MTYVWGHFLLYNHCTWWFTSVLKPVGEGHRRCRLVGFEPTTPGFLAQTSRPIRSVTMVAAGGWPIRILNTSEYRTQCLRTAIVHVSEEFRYHPRRYNIRQQKTRNARSDCQTAVGFIVIGFRCLCFVSVLKPKADIEHEKQVCLFILLDIAFGVAFIYLIDFWSRSTCIQRDQSLRQSVRWFWGGLSTYALHT